MTFSPVVRATAACVLFSAFGVAGFAYSGANIEAALPLLLFYALLVFHSFFPVREFSSMATTSRAQFVFDAALVALYGLLAFSFASPRAFLAAALALFIVSVAKYAHLALRHSSPALTRKILWTSLGVAIIAASLCAALLGYEVIGAWTLAVAYGLANVYLLVINPMYETRAQTPMSKEMP